jgi:GWxTD domain-containing protein
MLVTDFERDSLSLSDIMLISRLSTEGDKRKIVPNISGNVGTLGEGFFLFFEIYNKMPGDSIEVAWKVFNTDREEVGGSTQLEAAPENTTQAFVRVEDLKLPVGSYLVTVEAVPHGKAPPPEGPRAITSRNFSVRWVDIPASITDLKKAVEQLRYIAQPEEHDKILSAEPEEEMRKKFVEFWAKRDTDPTTGKNELMEEYYRRVEYANKNFGHYMDGWKTDRGMVYIRFGAPDNVERHPFDMNTKPYEIWYYYELERQFVFIDETGFGDYRLRYPTTDLWGRIR